MGLFDSIFGKNRVNEEMVPNLDEIMDSEGDIVSPPADFYIKRIDLRNEGDAELVMSELTKKNVIILNIAPIAKQTNRLKKIVSKLKAHVTKINGDIAMLNPETIVLAPRNSKIVKSKPRRR